MAGTLSNPFLERVFPFPFHRMEAAHVVPAVREALARAEATLEGLAAPLAPGEVPDWEGSVGALDALSSDLSRVTTPIHHLLSVAESPELREGWNEVLPELTAFGSRLSLNPGVHRRIQAFAASPAAEALDPLYRRHLTKTLRDFERAGAGLPEEERARLEALDVELSQLEQSFSEHVLDATAAWSLRIPAEEAHRLRGIPADALERAQGRAEAEGFQGWILGLDAPTVQAVLKHAQDRSLREALHRGWTARGVEAPWDNRPLIPRILELKRERAHMLGFANYPDYRLEEQMARSGSGAMGFLEDLVERTRPYWARDLAELEAHAAQLGLDRLRPWDVAFVQESLRKARYDLDEEALRPYFPLERVLEGMFEMAHRLFGLTVKAVEREERWHPDVQYYEIWDEAGILLAAFHADFFPRPEKRQGAWMSDFLYGNPDAGAPHLGNMCANFPPPTGNRPALLDHRDVETLFHEFGHLLHHCTSRIPLEGRGGIHVAWDFVELPSQLFENWCWEREALDLMSGHWETGEPLPEPLFRRMMEARRFMGGWGQMRQLSFGILDLALHQEYDAERDGDPVNWVTQRIRGLSANDEFAATHPLPSFLHLFSGGYAASYYAYLWSEVLEADLFSRFREEGIFSRSVGQAYLETILSKGDSEDPELLFRRFMGRDPDPEALLRRNLGESP
jgi:oligopeptidase A